MEKARLLVRVGPALLGAVNNVCSFVLLSTCFVVIEYQEPGAGTPLATIILPRQQT
jgi:hypothetical protein